MNDEVERFFELARTTPLRDAALEAGLSDDDIHKLGRTMEAVLRHGRDVRLTPDVTARMELFIGPVVDGMNALADEVADLREAVESSQILKFLVELEEQERTAGCESPEMAVSDEGSGQVISVGRRRFRLISGRGDAPPDEPQRA